ncbi:MAG: hypothetical protein ACPKPY_09605, partial [Nitrososphaeraceae archaeon]
AARQTMKAQIHEIFGMLNNSGNTLTQDATLAPELFAQMTSGVQGLNQSLAENNILSEAQHANMTLLGESLQTGTLPGILGLVAGHDQLLMSQDNLALSQQNTLANAELARQSMVDTLPDLFGLVGGTDQLKQSQEGVALGMQNTGSALTETGEQMTGFGEKVQSEMSLANQAFNALFGPHVGQAFGLFNSLLASIQTSSLPIFVEAMNTKMTEAGNMVANLSTAAGPHIGTFNSLLASIFGGGSSSEGGEGGNGSSKGGGSGGSSDFVSRISQTMEEAGHAVAKLPETARPYITEFQGLLSSIFTGGSEGEESDSSGGSGGKGKGGGGSSDFVSMISSKMTEAGNAVVNLPTAAAPHIEAFKGLLASLIGEGGGGSGGSSGSGSAGGESSGGGSSSSISNVSTFVTAMTSKMTEAGNAVLNLPTEATIHMSTFVGMMNEKFGEVEERVNNFVDAWKTDIDSFNSQLDNAIRKLKEFGNNITALDGLEATVTIKQKFSSSGSGSHARGGSFIAKSPRRIDNHLIAEQGPELITVTPFDQLPSIPLQLPSIPVPQDKVPRNAIGGTSTFIPEMELMELAKSQSFADIGKSIENHVNDAFTALGFVGFINELDSILSGVRGVFSGIALELGEVIAAANSIDLLGIAEALEDTTNSTNNNVIPQNIEITIPGNIKLVLDDDKEITAHIKDKLLANYSAIT